MACCTDDNYQPDCAGLCDGTRKHFVARVICRIFCGTLCRPSKWSRACCHHTLMAVCAFLAVVSATIAVTVVGLVNDVVSLESSGRCILFASFEDVELVTNSRSACAFSFIGDSIVACCALLLVVWFVVKARCGVGWKYEMWSSLVQLVAVTMMLVLSGSSGAVITVGFQRTCVSLSDYTNTTLNLIPCIQRLPIYLPDRNEVDAKLLQFFSEITLAMLATAWISAALVLILLAASVLSVFVHCLCSTCVARNKCSWKRGHPVAPIALAPLRQTADIPPPPQEACITPVQRAPTPPPSQIVVPPPPHTAIPPPPPHEAFAPPVQQAPTPPTPQAAVPPRPQQTPVPPPPLQAATPPSQQVVTTPAQQAAIPSTQQATIPPTQQTAIPPPQQVAVIPSQQEVSLPPVSPYQQAVVLPAMVPDLQTWSSITVVPQVMAMVPQAKKTFSLPCHYAPLFGHQHIQHIISAMETNHHVKFSVPDQRGSQTDLKALCQTIFLIFYSPTQTSASCEHIPRVDDPRICNYLVPSLLSKFQWFWQENNGSFSPYDPQLNYMLQMNYHSTPTGSFTYDARKYKYTIDFACMSQTNQNTGRKRSIKCEGCTVEWKYKQEMGTFVSHTRSNSEAIERMFAASNSSTLRIAGTTFTFDFTSMKQIDTITSQACDIHRHVASCNTAFAAYDLTLQVEGTESNLDTVVLDLRRELDSLLDSLEHVIGGKHCSVERNAMIELTLLQDASRYFVSAAITSGKIKLHGTNQQIHKVMMQLLQQLLTIAETPTVSTSEVPQSWSPQNSDNQCELFQLHRGSNKWSHVQSLVHATIPNAEIQSLERVQNRWLWEKYSFARQRLLKKNHGIINEKELFHGTKNNPPETILKSEHGFDFRFASRGMWGEGAYFAVNASYSGNSYGYCRDKKTQIILAMVLTGDTCCCKSDSTLKQPPQKPHSSNSKSVESFKDERYDSVSGHTGGSDIYIIYDHEKAYPAYLITYTKSS